MTKDRLCSGYSPTLRPGLVVLRSHVASTPSPPSLHVANSLSWQILLGDPSGDRADAGS